jgi:hypothetical protein
VFCSQHAEHGVLLGMNQCQPAMHSWYQHLQLLMANWPSLAIYHKSILFSTFIGGNVALHTLPSA